MNYEQHPLKCLQRLIVSDRLESALFSFRRYVRLGSSDGPAEYRTLDYFDLIGADVLDRAVMETRLENAGPLPEDLQGYEGVAVDIALCSPVRVTQDCTLYLPMLDMTTDTPWAPVQSPQKCALASWARGVGAEIYLTGRASHVYVPKLLTQAEWLAFLGRAILDLPVDVRWIGHGLISGVHALRWTCNSPDYLQPPIKWEGHL